MIFLFFFLLIDRRFYCILPVYPDDKIKALLVLCAFNDFSITYIKTNYDIKGGQSNRGRGKGRGALLVLRIMS
jgi:hypothetical protein